MLQLSFKIYGQSVYNLNLDLCGLPLERGPCEAAISSWGYNPIKKRCEHFYYGGCHGNDNNFESKDKCERACPQPGE